MENGRRTELSAAIEVLNHLNEGDKNETSRVLLRRLCRGGLVSARLLQEGVLEQDRRVRQEFRHTLVPLLALTHTPSLEILECIQQPNSKLWLRGFLLDHLKEADMSESFGAILSLLRILPDGDSATPEVHNYFMAAPPSFRSAVLQALNSQRRGDADRQVSDWVLAVIIDTLCASDWWRLDVNALNSAIEILRLYRDKCLRIAEISHKSSRFAAVLRCLLDERKEPVEIGTDYGVIKEIFVANDWTSTTQAFSRHQNDK